MVAHSKGGASLQILAPGHMQKKKISFLSFLWPPDFPELGLKTGIQATWLVCRGVRQLWERLPRAISRALSSSAIVQSARTHPTLSQTQEAHMFVGSRQRKQTLSDPCQTAEMRGRETWQLLEHSAPHGLGHRILGDPQKSFGNESTTKEELTEQPWLSHSSNTSCRSKMNLALREALGVGVGVPRTGSFTIWCVGCGVLWRGTTKRPE